MQMNVKVLTIRLASVSSMMDKNFDLAAVPKSITIDVTLIVKCNFAKSIRPDLKLHN